MGARGHTYISTPPVLFPAAPKEIVDAKNDIKKVLKEAHPEYETNQAAYETAVNSLLSTVAFERYAEISLFGNLTDDRGGKNADKNAGREVSGRGGIARTLGTGVASELVHKGIDNG